MKRQTGQAYAIVRVDDSKSAPADWQLRITVKEIVASEADAKAEVERLDALNGAKGSTYFYQLTRLVGVSA